MVHLTLTNDIGGYRPYHMDALKALKPTEDQALVIVPEQYTLQAEEDLMALLKTKGLMHIEVMSFKRLINRIDHIKDHDQEEVLTDLGKKMLLRQLMSDPDNALVLYRQAINLKGFLDDLATTLSELQQNAVSPILVHALASSMDQEKPLFQIKMKEVAWLYDAYIKRLGHGLIDEEQQMARAIKEAHTLPWIPNRLIIVEGFSSMTGQEIDLLVELASLGCPMMIRLIDPQNDLVTGRYVKNLKDQIIRAMNEAQLTVALDQNLTVEPHWARQFTGLFAPGQSFKALDLGHGLKLFKAATKKNEVEVLVSDMLHQVIHQKIAWHEFAILTNDLDRYHRIIKQVCEAYRVPYFMDQKRSALTHRGIDFVLSSLKVLQSNFKGTDVLKVFKTDFLPLTYDDICQIENVVYAKRTIGRQWLEVWEDLPPEVEAAKQKALSYLVTLQREMKQALTGQARIEALRHYLDQTGFLEGLAALCDEKRSEGDLAQAEELAQIHNIVDEVLYQTLLIGSEHIMGSEDLYELLKLGFSSYEIGIIPPYQDAVIVGNLSRTRLKKVKHLYILGFNDGVLPSRKASAGLFNEQEVSWLMAQGVRKLASPMAKYDEEVYKLYEHLLKATDSVTWSYSLSEGDGGDLKPSLWLTQVTQAYGLECPYKDVTLTRQEALQVPGPFLDSALVLLKAGGDLSPSQWSYLKALYEDPGYHWQMKTFFEGLSYSNEAKPIDTKLVQALYGDYLKTSVTRLESYSRCPYQHFVTYGLKPSKRILPDLSGLDIGDLFHEVVEGVMNHVKDMDPKGLESHHWEACFENVYTDALEDRYRFDMNDKNRFYAKKLKTVLKDSLDKVMFQMSRGAFKIMGNEVTFGIGSDKQAPPLILETSSGAKILLEGKIDRLDTVVHAGLSYVRIVDYKSGQKDFRLEDLVNGLSLQLMLYLQVAKAHVQEVFKNPAMPFGAFYFKLDEPYVTIDGLIDDEVLETELIEAFKMQGICLKDLSLIALNDDQFEDLEKSQIIPARLKKSGELYDDAHLLEEDELKLVVAFAKQQALMIVEDIYAGKIDILPYAQGNHKACDWCEYRSICQFDANKSNATYRILKKMDKDQALACIKEVVGSEVDK